MEFKLDRVAEADKEIAAVLEKYQVEFGSEICEGDMVEIWLRCIEEEPLKLRVV